MKGMSSNYSFDSSHYNVIGSYTDCRRKTRLFAVSAGLCLFYSFLLLIRVK